MCPKHITFTKLTCTRLVPHSFQATVSWAWLSLPPLKVQFSKPKCRVCSLILLLVRKSLATVTVMAATVQWTEMAPIIEIFLAALRKVAVVTGAEMVVVRLATVIVGVDALDIIAVAVVVTAVDVLGVVVVIAGEVLSVVAAVGVNTETEMLLVVAIMLVVGAVGVNSGAL